MGARIGIRLSEEDRARLRAWADSGPTGRRIAARAAAVPMSADGAKSGEIAARTGMCRKTVGAWRGRFRDGGADTRRPAGAEERAAILAPACTKPPDGLTRLTVRKRKRPALTGRAG